MDFKRLKNRLIILILVSTFLPVIIVSPFTEATQQAQNINKKTVESYNYDVVVVGGTSSGVAAAVAAGRMGTKVALIEETNRIGGMITNGLSVTDLGSPGIESFNFKASSGIFEEFRQRVKIYYHNYPFLEDDYRGKEGLKYEPKVAHKIIKQMVAEVSNITVFYDSWPIFAGKDGDTLARVTIQNKAGEIKTLNAQVFVDATDNGDLAVLAGAEFMLGREGRTPEEPHAGIIFYNNETNQLLPGSTGEADARIQAYSFLMTFKDYGPGVDKTILQPLNYNSEKYRYSPSWEETWTATSGVLPNKKFEVNVHPFGADLPEANYDYPTASRETRKNIEELYKNHALGYLYFLQTERGLKNLGLADDEYPENGNFPLKLYVREGRRVRGEYLMKENDITPASGSSRATLKSDSIAIGDYPMDSHATQLKKNPSAPHKGEGEFWLYRQTRPYQIPFGVIVPKNTERLLVSLAVSATHVAYGSLRMEPVRMSLGQAAGTAAALAVRNDILPHQVNIEQLQEELLRQKQSLFYYRDVPLNHWAFENIQELSLKNIMTGYADYSFGLDKEITRAEMAAVLVKIFNLPKVQPSTSTFPDVPRSHWAYECIEIVKAHGAIGGYEDGTFKPDDYVTRAEMAKMMVISANLDIDTSGDDFSDVPQSHWAYECIKTAKNNGIVGGYSDGTFKPSGNTTRAEASSMIYRVLNL